MASLGLALVSGFVLPVRAFNFTTNITAVRACGDVLVTWQGGAPPYNLTVIVSCALRGRRCGGRRRTLCCSSERVTTHGKADV